MFQYAAGRRAAVVNRWPLKLDGSAFRPGSPRAYGLDALNVEAPFLTPAEVGAIIGPPHGLGKRLHRIRRRFKIGYRWSWIREDRLSTVDPRILAAPPYTYIDGYWQSEKYFADIAETIRDDFRIESWVDPRARAIAGQVLGSESVSLHVRRGDYVTDPRTNQAHGTCTIEYYQEAARQIAGRVSRPHFFLFSDDPGWVGANLKLDHPATLVSQQLSGNQYDDLRLMSLCRHHIIANSSFSWWGAWLNPRPEKIVLAPRRWANDPNWDDRDLLPASWVRV